MHRSQPERVGPHLTAVNQPIVTPLQGTVNGLLGILVPPLNINVTGIVNNAVAGAPVSVDVLTTGGTIVGPGDCNVAIDGLTLNTPGGIGIGGNQISGLGTGQAASAGTLDSIAFGNGAITGGTATGAVALGNGANVTAANSVALGNGSIADRGALTGYTAIGLPGTFNSAGTVSIGAPGALRQLTNLAPGTAASDAATVGQVQGALDAVDNLADIAVQFSDTSHSAIVLDGAAGTTISGVAPGALTASSTEAVNGSQLFATNAQVATNTGAIAGLGTRVTDAEADIAANTGAIAGLDTRVTDNTAGIAGLDTRVTTNSNAIAGLDTRVTDNTADIAGLDTRVTQNTADIAANAAGIAANTGAIAELDARVTDNTANIAANTSAIAALGTQVGSNTADIAGLDTRVTANTAGIAANTGAIAGLDARVTTNTTAIAGLDTRVTQNAADIAGLDSRVTTNTSAIAGLDARVTDNTAAIAGIDARVTDNSAAIAANAGAIAGNTTAIAGLDTRVTTNTADIAALQAGLGNVPVGYANDADPSVRSATPTDTAAFISASGGAVTVTNVAAGEIAAGSTDAVNGGQLAATNAAVAANTSAISTNTRSIADINAWATATSGTIANNTSMIMNNSATITTQGVALAALDARAVEYDNSAHTSVTFDGAGGTRLSGVAPGAVAAGSTDAVNGSQLAATNGRVTTIENNLAGSTVVAVQYSNPGNPNVSNGGTVTNDVAFVGANAAAPVAVHNVAAGTLATDAVNLGQVQSQLTSAMTTAQSYTDTRVAAAMDLMSTQMTNVQFDLGELRRDAMSGIAGAMAFAGIPQTMDVGRSMVGGAVAYYRGQTAFAFGFSSALNDGKAAIKIGGSVDTRGNAGVTAGAGFSF